MKKIISILLICIAPLIMGAEEGQKPQPSLIVSAPVTKGAVNPLQTFVGTLYYDKQSKLASEFEGVVQKLSVVEGQQIKKGDIVVELDSQVLQAKVAAKASAYKALQADLTRQELDLERTKTLHERKSISQSIYDRTFYATEQLRARTQATKSELKALNIQLEKNRIKAPFDGVVTSRNVDVGEWVGKGATIATIVATDSLEARLNIPARLIDILSSLKSFQATIEGHDIEVNLKTVIPVADASTRTFPVEMEIPKNKGFIEGMRVDVQVPTLKEQESLMVPRDAVIRRFGQTVVFAAVEGQAVMIPVQVIGYKTDLAAIAGDGIAENMRVVVKGNERIFPNMPLMEKEVQK